MRDFMKGLDLCERFYREAVRPILKRHLPDLVYSAGRLGQGSDVLGFDTPTSMDHDWGPQLDLFLSEADFLAHSRQIDAILRQELPPEVCGFSTHFFNHEDNTTGLQKPAGKPINHGVKFTTVPAFFNDYLGLDPSRPLEALDWLSLPPQKLRTISAGRVFHDGLCQLDAARRQLKWYPQDIWLYLMANQWRRIDQEEPFVGRCGDVGDELGSQVVASRQVTEIMRLCFLIEKSHAPYFKWFGTAFAQLDCAKRLTPVLRQVFASATWKERERHLSAAYLILANMHNALGVTPAIDPKVSPFHQRPYLVPHSERFYEALHRAIQSPTVKALPMHVGAVWQFADSTDVLCSGSRCQALTSIYEAEQPPG